MHVDIILILILLLPTHPEKVFISNSSFFLSLQNVAFITANFIMIFFSAYSALVSDCTFIFITMNTDVIIFFSHVMVSLRPQIRLFTLIKICRCNALIAQLPANHLYILCVCTEALVAVVGVIVAFKHVSMGVCLSSQGRLSTLMFCVYLYGISLKPLI